MRAGVVRVGGGVVVAVVLRAGLGWWCVDERTGLAAGVGFGFELGVGATAARTVRAGVAAVRAAGADRRGA